VSIAVAAPDYTALEILAVGGLTVATGTAVAEPETKKTSLAAQGGEGRRRDGGQG